MSLNYASRCLRGGLLLIPAITTGLLSSFLISGCSKPAAAPTGPSFSDDDIIATVNGVAITKDQMYGEMEQYVPAQIQGFPQNPILGYPAGRVALQKLIEDQLEVQLATVNGVPVTTDEVTARYNDVKMVKESQITRSFEDILADQGLTPQEFDDGTITPNVAQYNLVSKGVTVSSQEIMAYYNTHLSAYTEPDRVHIERIILPDEATAEKAYQDASKTNTLDDVMGQNIAPPLSGGDDAADIAQWFDIDSPPTALKAALAPCATAQPETVLPPVAVQKQWWLVKLVDRQPKQVLPFSEVQHIVQWNLTMMKAGAAGGAQRFQGQMQDMTQQAVINVKPQQYDSLVKELKNPPLTSPMQSAPQQPSH
jgi:parvulin-like peptidyl-prolyl isomerase